MTEHQKFRLKTRDLFNQVSSASELETRLSMMERLPRGYKMWIQIVFLSGGLDELIKRKAYRIHSHRLLDDGGAILQIVKSIGRKEKIKLDGHLAMIPTAMANIYRVVSISDSPFWNKAGSKFIESCYPLLVRIFFRQAELRNILLGFEQSLGVKI